MKTMEGNFTMELKQSFSHAKVTKTSKKNSPNLKTVRRKEVAERLKQAIDFGDLSENYRVR